MWGGALVEGDQVAPLSRLNSVNTSKKLLTTKLPPGVGEIAVLPVEASVGLSRRRMPGGRLPPDMSNCSISVWYNVNPGWPARTRKNLPPPLGKRLPLLTRAQIRPTHAIPTLESRGCW